MPGTAERSRNPVSVAAVIAIVALVLALGLNAAYTTWAVSASQHHWCATLTLLNAADAGHPPTAGYGRALADDFRMLHRNLGCGS